MRIAITGATGFLGHYIVARLAAQGHDCRCWHRPTSDRGGLQEVSPRIEWLRGELGDSSAVADLVEGCDAVVHAALYHPGGGFRGEGNLVEFVERNVLGSLALIENARRAGVGRFIFISTCAVHEKILDGRPLDETHPTWALSHYGAHKAAIEQFVHSYGYGQGYPICALRPTGIYGLAGTGNAIRRTGTAGADDLRNGRRDSDCRLTTASGSRDLSGRFDQPHNCADQVRNNAPQQESRRAPQHGRSSPNLNQPIVVPRSQLVNMSVDSFVRPGGPVGSSHDRQVVEFEPIANRPRPGGPVPHIGAGPPDLRNQSPADRTPT